jgi:MFS family permease
LIVAWAICTFGSFLVVIGFHISIVALGLFLSGFGADAANSLTFLFFCEVVNNKKRQKYSILMQIFFTIGALVATTLFYWINDWRIVWSLIVVAPALV